MAIRGTLTHRKARRLARSLNIDPCFALGVMESVWHVTGEQQPDGGIGRMSNQDIADEILYTGDAEVLVRSMIDAVLLDETPNSHRLYVHDWHIWADYAVISKLVKKRQRFANGCVPNLNKYSDEYRQKIAHEYDVKFGAQVAQTEHGAQVAQTEHGAQSALPARAPKPEPVPVARGQRPEPVPVARGQRPVVNTHTVEKATGVIANGNGHSGSRLQFMADETFTEFRNAAVEFWGELVTDEEFYGAWMFTWKSLSVGQKLAITKSVRARIDAGENPRFVTQIPKYLETGAWKKPPRVDKQIPIKPKSLVMGCPICKSLPCECLKRRLEKGPLHV